jgi:hypothetical protein
MSKNGVCPKVYYFGNSSLVLEFLQSEPFEKQDLIYNEKMMIKLAFAVSKLHSCAKSDEIS